MRKIFLLLVLLSTPSIVWAQGLDPEEAAAFRMKVRNYWVAPAGVPRNVWVGIRIKLKRDGSVDGVPVIVSGTADRTALVLAESAKRAVIAGAPYTMFKPEHYALWKDITIKFDMADVPDAGRDAQIVAQAHERERQLQLARTKESITRNYAIELWTNPSALSANPFIFQGKVVGVLTSFDHMISASEAIFDGLYVSDVPSTMFQGRVFGVLAGRVTGNKGTKTQFGGERLLPALSFVGFHPCALNECNGF